jgi:hypothetical protein
MSFKTRVLETLRSVFFAHPSTKIPHGMINASETIYRQTAPGFVASPWHFSFWLHIVWRNLSSQYRFLSKLPSHFIFADLSLKRPSLTTLSRRLPYRTTSVSVASPSFCVANQFVYVTLGDLRKGVDFSDPNLPKMTMTTFDGKPYIETYTLSKLEIVQDFGTEHKVAPTPVCSLRIAYFYLWNGGDA